MPTKNINKPEPTDMEIFFWLNNHLKNPCGTMINGKWHTIRYFWEERAEEALPKMTNPFAKDLLRKAIDEKPIFFE